MQSYDDSHFDPPAPVTQVTLRNPSSGVSISDVILLLDTGADVTLLPRHAVAGLGISPVAGQGYELITFDGRTSFASAVTLDMIFLNRTFRGQYLLIEDDRGILGRDILNHIVLLLDGPRQRWQEHSP
jgi:hypothetical protein